MIFLPRMSPITLYLSFSSHRTILSWRHFWIIRIPSMITASPEAMLQKYLSRKIIMFLYSLHKFCCCNRYTKCLKGNRLNKAWSTNLELNFLKNKFTDSSFAFNWSLQRCIPWRYVSCHIRITWSGRGRDLLSVVANSFGMPVTS